LANKKPGPKNAWWSLPEEKVKEVIELTTKWKEIATNYVIGIKAGISASSAGKILHEYLGPRKEEKERRHDLKTCDWMKMHVCWALDTIKIPSKEGYVYVQLLIEEYSRCVLGWILSYSNTGEKAKTLIQEAIEKHNITPLVIKTDRGSEFVNDVVKSYLKEKEILYMPSPGHYPLFNGRLERENRIFRQFLKKKGGLTTEEILKRLEKAIYVSNHELPRRIFSGKTSADIFKKGEIYKKEEKEILKQKVEERIKEIEELKTPGLDKLDVLRKAVVNCVVDMGLCTIKSGDRNVNLLAV
jgi:hypothetical protein